MDISQFVVALKEHHEQQALEARRRGQYVDIDWMLPSVLVYHGPDKEFRFTEKQAQTLLDTVGPLVQKAGCSIKDAILSMSQEWSA